MGWRDPRTVQHWLGHSHMKSTMRYLKASRSHVRGKVNKIPAWRFWTGFWLAISSSPSRKLLIPRHCGSTNGFDKQIYAAGTTRGYSLIFSCEQNKAEGTVRVCIVHQISFDFAGPQAHNQISLP
jgi:hypothetical protein